MLLIEDLLPADRSEPGYFGTEVTCWRVGDLRYTWAFAWAYDFDLIALFKEFVPWQHRRWLAAEGCWLVEDDWAHRIVDRLVALGYPVVGFI